MANKYINELENEKGFVNGEFIDEIFKRSEISIKVEFDKSLTMTAKLPNGFCITTSSGCVRPENFSHEIGVDICSRRLKDEIWKFYGFILAEKLYQEQ